MTALAAKGDKNNVMRLYEEYKETGYTANDTVWNILKTAHAAAGDLKGLMNVFDMMTKEDAVTQEEVLEGARYILGDSIGDTIAIL
jgi:hypothetical protein